MNMRMTKSNAMANRTVKSHCFTGKEDRRTIEIVEIEQKMVGFIHDTRVSGFVPDGMDDGHGADQDAPLSEGEDTNGDGHPSFPFP